MVPRNTFQTDTDETRAGNSNEGSPSASHDEEVHYHSAAEQQHGHVAGENRVSPSKGKNPSGKDLDITANGHSGGQRKFMSEEQRQRNLDSSVRFRLKRRDKVNDLANKIQIENEKIEDFKQKLHRLEIENTCLRKMLLGNWNPQIDNQFMVDEGMLNSSVTGDMTNVEILRNLKHGRSS